MKKFYYTQQSHTSSQNLNVSWWKRLLQREVAVKYLMCCFCLETKSLIFMYILKDKFTSEYSKLFHDLTKCQYFEMTLQSAPYGKETGWSEVFWKWDIYGIHTYAGQRLLCAWQTLDLPQISSNLITDGLNVIRVIIFTCLAKPFKMCRCLTKINVSFLLFYLFIFIFLITVHGCEVLRPTALE